MQSRMLIAPAVIAGLCLAGPAKAQDINPLVLKMAKEIDDLKAEIEPLKALLQGAVVAFDRSQAMGACPKGWKLFEPAGGRFIVGAGTNTNKDFAGNELTDHPAFKDDAAKAVGGEEKHQLTALENGPHFHNMFNHKFQISSQEGGNGLKLLGEGGVSASPLQVDTQSAGNGHPHNTMPPFVALYFCIKE